MCSEIGEVEVLFSKLRNLLDMLLQCPSVMKECKKNAFTEKAPHRNNEGENMRLDSRDVGSNFDSATTSLVDFGQPAQNSHIYNTWRIILAAFVKGFWINI